MSLTQKQQVFVNEYLKCWNASEAAKRAGYRGSSATLRSVGSENLTKPNITTAIDERLAELKASADEVLTRLTRHARGSMADFITIVDGKPTFDWTRANERGALDLVKKYKVDKDGQISIELYDAQAALVQLGKFHRLFVDRTEVSGAVHVDVSVDDLADLFRQMGQWEKERASSASNP